MKKIAALTVLSVVVSAQAQVAVVGPGTYYQNFDSLANSGLGNAWTNNLPTLLMPGWYSTLPTYDADDGNMSLAGQYSYGSILTSGAPSPERALGSISWPGMINTFGVRMNNASGGAFGSVTVNYTGEQWRSGAAIPDVLNFEYSTNATSLMTGTWTAVPTLDFNSPNNTGAFAIDGNLPANQALMNQNLGITWANGTDLWLRWKHIGGASRHGMAIDDVHVTTAVVPEPASMLALLPALALLRKRKLAK